MHPSFVVARAAPPSLLNGLGATSTVSIDSGTLRSLLGQVVASRRKAFGLSGPYDSLVNPIIDGILKKLGPTVGDWAKTAAIEAEPKIRQIAKEEVAPTVGQYAALGLLGAGVFAAVIGAFFASRGRRG